MMVTREWGINFIVFYFSLLEVFPGAVTSNIPDVISRVISGVIPDVSPVSRPDLVPSSRFCVNSGSGQYSRWSDVKARSHVRMCCLHGHPYILMCGIADAI